MTMPIRSTTDDNRTPTQVAADDKVREEVEATGGAFAQMTPEQREQLRARVQERKQAAEAARVRKQAEDDKTIEDRVARLEERVARFED